MTSQYINEVIQHKCLNYDLIVLKGFSPTIIAELGETYALLDDYCIKEGKIILENINDKQLLRSIMNLSDSMRAICTCESFINMCIQFNDLNILDREICVLENNLLELYPNPSNMDIPDFDSTDFEDTDQETALYSCFYAFCVRENDKQKIQYIDNYSFSNHCVEQIYLIDPEPYNIAGTANEASNYKLISAKDESLNNALEELYNNMNLSCKDYLVEAEDVDEEKIKVFVQAAKSFGQTINIYNNYHDINTKPRQEIFDTLKRIWGYDSFRNLKIYTDLNINRDVSDISQGSIIETVIQQAEHAYLDQKDCVKNVLLTSPTGAGKSLLFQLSAIYLAEKYGLLTLVISPLVALMNDQVEGLSGYNGIATLNSNKTAAEKEAILNGVHDGSINILYLSPELLLSYTITFFIGDRKLGLFVVDEAHTVTTWGRDFRVDYWFLGDYLRKAKRIIKHPFPIFALTATAVWDPSGKNDMVFDTIRSLNMDPCIKFIGVVRRNNITFEIENSTINKNYEEKRKQLTIQRIREALNLKRKTIVYFPFKRTVDSIVSSGDIEDIQDKITRYHANLFPEDKSRNAEDFRNGSKPIMCATKAFGMGIDVSDIQEVYHHAPTGCLSDYVQEIGRLARNPDITGIAKIDFSPNDFRYIRKLHGLSAIKPYQLIQVLKKLMAIYDLNGEKRNMLISSSDFTYIFPLANQDSIDQNLKSCLLLISNDLLNKLRFHALIVRPKSLFSQCFIEVNPSEQKSFYRHYHNYLSHIEGSIYILNADKLWTNSYNNISFPKFKHNLAEGKIFDGYNVALKNKVTLKLHDTVPLVHTAIEEFFKLAHQFLNEMSSSHHRIDLKTMKTTLPQKYDNVKREQFVETFRMLYATPSALGSNIAAYCKVSTKQDGPTSASESFQLMQSGYENVSNIYLTAYNRLVQSSEFTVYCDTNDDIIKLSEFLNSFGVADYQRLSGDQPVIFVRINNPYYLKQLIKGNKYKNDILENIYEKYRFSERIFTYFFTTKMTDEQRWDFIEAYFLGESEEKLLNFV